MSPTEHARALLAGALGMPVTAIGEDATFDQIDRWDSIAHLRVVLAVEEKIGRMITSDETMSLFSVKQIADLLA